SGPPCVGELDAIDLHALLFRELIDFARNRRAPVDDGAEGVEDEGFDSRYVRLPSAGGLRRPRCARLRRAESRPDHRGGSNAEKRPPRHICGVPAHTSSSSFPPIHIVIQPPHPSPRPRLPPPYSSIRGIGSPCRCASSTDGQSANRCSYRSIWSAPDSGPRRPGCPLERRTASWSPSPRPRGSHRSPER